MTHADAVRTLAVERYLLDEMPEIERYAFEEHYFDCAECAEDLRAGSTMRNAAKAALLADVADTSSRSHAMTPAASSRRWSPAAVIPWAAAATLALVVGYQSLGTSGDGRLQIRALTPVTLRPDSRGAVPTISIAEGQDAVTVAMDIDARPGSELIYILTSSAGEPVAEGRLTAPPAGTPLLLLLPEWTLTPSTQYSLSVQGAADGQAIGDYRFAVAAR